MQKHNKIKIGKVGRKVGQQINYELISSSSINLKNTDLLDAFTKIAVLIVLAGYKKCNYINVNDKLNNNINLKELSQYLSYVLNHPEFAPIKYNLKITDQEKLTNKKPNFTENNYDSIISFSGGIDSTAGLLHFLDKEEYVQPLWISFGQRNSEAELNAVKRVLNKLEIDPFIIKMNINKYILNGWKEWSYIVPGRNFVFLSFANAILKQSKKEKGAIYLCAHKDEMKHHRNTDKSKYFFEKATKFFTISNQKNIIATTPFADISKTEILSYWKRNWLQKYKTTPHDTTSCYYEHGCGECEVCLKQTISLLASGFDIDPFLKTHPMKDPSGLITNKWISKLKSNKFTKIKKLDFLIAIEKSLDIVPKEAKELYKNLPHKTLSAIEERKREIKTAKI